ncbi:MAG TPA: HAMP domain-containing sensor histidine kinase, partial [Vicinamibacterales bacterium]
FARQYRQQLFPDRTLLFTSLDQRYLDAAPLGENEAAVPASNDFPKLVDDILQLLPGTRQVFMVIGSGRLAEFWHQQLEHQFAPYRDRLTFLWSDDMALPEILERCARLPRDSAILYITLGADAQGGAYADERVLSELHATASAPLFSAQSVMLGHGVVGGTMMSIDTLSHNAARSAAALLNGASPRSIQVPTQFPGPRLFDWRELERWGIPESRVPPGSTVRYRRPTLWSEYRSTVLTGVGALILQSLLIVGLLYQRRARQRAEGESRKNLALAAAVSRRQTMSALTSTIAHELGQPLSALMLNARALQRMVAGPGGTADPIGEIVSDIEADGLRATQIIDRHRTMLRTREVTKAPIDLRELVNESLALVAHDIHARQVTTTLHLPSTACVISGDQVLLQQVFVNLVVNAMDAMAATPSPWRRLTIGTDVRAGEVDVLISDKGTGVPPDVVDTLFTEFMTTKPHGLGLGLTIVRTILDAHGGAIAARNNPDGGATFIVTLTRNGAAEPGPWTARP